MQREKNHWIYTHNEDLLSRYTLGEKADKMIACLGVNPSTAEPDHLDRTLQSVKRIASFNGFDGWLMLNLYPQRATNPKDLPQKLNKELHVENLHQIIDSIERYKIQTVWLAFGDLIESRYYLKDCAKEILYAILGRDLQCKIVSELSAKGHPKHPLYKSKESVLQEIDLSEYLNHQLYSISEQRI